MRSPASHRWQKDMYLVVALARACTDSRWLQKPTVPQLQTPGWQEPRVGFSFCFPENCWDSVDLLERWQHRHFLPYHSPGATEQQPLQQMMFGSSFLGAEGCAVQFQALCFTVSMAILKCNRYYRENNGSYHLLHRGNSFQQWPLNLFSILPVIFSSSSKESITVKSALELYLTTESVELGSDSCML